MSKIFNEKDEGTLKPEKRKPKEVEEETSGFNEEEEDDEDVDILSEDEEFMDEE
jgi:hypothetical protein